MAMYRIFSNSIVFAGLVSLGALAGCSSGTTYGTGVSQEAQLASDLGGMLLLGTGEKKQSIDYTSRPKLVKAPAAGTLPSPAERVTSDSAYFPTDPEQARAQRTAELGRGRINEGSAAYGADTRVRDSGLGPVDRKNFKKFRNEDHEESAAEMLKTSVEGREQRLARAREARGLTGGAAPRKYLTQPPKEYRAPAETAAAGQLGEYEKSEAEKRKKPFFGGWKTR